MTEQTYNLAFVFPGEGSQSTGMVNDLAATYPEIKQTFERASEALQKDLWALVTDETLATELNLKSQHTTCHACRWRCSLECVDKTQCNLSVMDGGTQFRRIQRVSLLIKDIQRNSY
ncbi:hypothetical protein LBMAG43_04730 [Methylococcaceae bacterium]|nr:hypothetical protein LBMAG43_04730 [Methylococcaceae bacterium]